MNPVVMVFARETSAGLTSLVKKIDAATVANQDKNMCSFVVFLSDDEKLADVLKAFAKKEEIKQTILATDNVAGPPGYNIAKDADITVIMYNERKVEVNQAFRKGALNAGLLQKLMARLPKIFD